jgi:hypothetical protein
MQYAVVRAILSRLSGGADLYCEYGLWNRDSGTEKGPVSVIVRHHYALVKNYTGGLVSTKKTSLKIYFCGLGLY